MPRFLTAWTRRNRLWRSYRVGQLLLRTLFIINRERTKVLKARARGDYDVHPDLEALLRILREFRETAIALGGLLIKLGQFLGARADLLPPEALAELAMLRDDVPPERFKDIRDLLEREWRVPVTEVCAEIDAKAAGSASLGQVHRARLNDGRDVAIKVQRPGIDELVRTDLRTLRFVLRFVGWLVPEANRIIDLDVLFKEFNRTVTAELDYEQEARNAKQFATMFADDPDIRVPGIVSSYTTRRVLVMEWMDGIKIANVDELDAAGVNRQQLANHLMGSYFKQVLSDGFFHADPHPGNFLVQPNGDSARLVFLDFGMMGTITQKMRDGLLDTFQGFIARDAARIIRGMDKLGFLNESVDREALEPVMSKLLTLFEGSGGLSSTSDWRRRGGDPREVFGDFGETLYDQPFRLPAQFAFFGRMVGMLQGLAVALDPEFNFLAVSTPYAQQFMGGGEEGGFAGILRMFGIDSVESLGQTLLRDGVATFQSLAVLPRRIERILENAEKGELRIIVESADDQRRRKRGSRTGLGKNGEERRGLLNRPVPLWLPVTLASAFGLILLTRATPQNHNKQ
jgi:predicted unusual protein kinase regulating ubiquinone biosynthesis (AarF/ABC1/UbiB family)